MSDNPWQSIDTVPRYGWVPRVDLKVQRTEGTVYPVLDVVFSRGFWRDRSDTRAFPPDHAATHWRPT